MFVAVGYLEGVLILILCGMLIFFGSKIIIQKLFKNQPSKRVNFIAMLASILLNPIGIFMLIGAMMYQRPGNQEYIKMTLEYEKRMLEETDQEFTEESIIGKTKGEILKRYGSPSNSVDSMIIYDFSTLTSTFIIEIEIENDKAVSINKKRK